MDPDPHIRTITRTRRRSTCHRHPNEPVTGLCALCLRDRLAGLDSSTDHLQLKPETIVSFPLSRRTRGHGGASSSAVVPELRRSKSVAVEKCENLNDSRLDLRRKSCDVRVSNNRLTDLFEVDNTNTGRDGDDVTVESKNLGFCSVTEPVLEIIDIEEEEEEEEDLRTMKEHIELEFQNKKNNFWEAASVFSHKLRKWSKKHKKKKQTNNNNNNNRSSFSRFRDSKIQSEVADYALGRRSCDAAAPRVSIEDPRFSYDEHRASWDGYMIARTIPRLTPMLPVVDDMILPPVNKRIAVKEEVSSKSNSDSSSSNTGSSSSSMKSSSSKTAGFDGNYIKSVSRTNDVIGQETKLVITEREFSDWHLESASKAPVSTCRTVKNGWRKVSNFWSYKSKLSDKKNEGYIHENSPSLNRNSSYVGSRNRSELYPNGEEGGRHSVSDIESGLMRLHFSSFGKSRKKLDPSTATDG